MIGRPDVAMDPAGDGTRRFWWTLIGVAAAGLAIRLVVVGFASRALLFGDGFWYQGEAHIIAGGHGFLSPGPFLAGRHLATAEHPPLFPAILALVTWSGHGSVVAYQVTCAFLGTAGVVAVGLLGRAVAGANVGVIAAALAAVAPNLWQYDALVLSESMLVLSLALFLLAVYRFRERPDVPRALLMGGALALAAYTRTELALLGLVIVVPMVLLGRGGDGGFRRVRLVAVAGLAGVALMAPWTVRNMTTFRQPVYFSNNLDSVIAGANCESSYYGRGIGSWNFACNTGPLPRSYDQSEVFAEYRHRGVLYLNHHLDRLPVVMAARVGRTWQVFRPFQDIGSGGRDDWLWIASAVGWYLSVGLGALGAWQLHRRRRAVWPLIILIPFVSVLAAFGYGLPRLRMPLDVALVVLAAVPVESWWCRITSRNSGQGRAACVAPSAATADPTAADAPLSTRSSVLRRCETVPTRVPDGSWMPICAPT